MASGLQPLAVLSGVQPPHSTLRSLAPKLQHPWEAQIERQASGTSGGNGGNGGTGGGGWTGGDMGTGTLGGDGGVSGGDGDGQSDLSG